MGIYGKIKYLLRKIIGDNTNSMSISNNQPHPIFNINQTINSNQKRIAFVYIRSAWDKPIIIKDVFHPNLIHQVAMVSVLCKLGYCIDIYSCYQEKINVSKSKYANKYDVIFGFGIQYIQLCQANPNAIKILFVTENAPWIVRKKYAERVLYFQDRHPEIVLKDSPRTDFYTDEMFDISESGIAVTGSFNMSEIKQRLHNTYRIDVNGLYNPLYKYNVEKNHEITKTHFVWFGSRGFVHKGLDILLDAFVELPQLSLDIYGIDLCEFSNINIPENVSVCGVINVMDENFIHNVVYKNTFVLSLSCSEGMQTGLTTCMMHGLIPVVTKECGIDDHKDIIYFDNYDVDSVISKLLSVSQMSASELKEIEKRIHENSVVDFSIESFTINFEKCFAQLIKQ